MIFTALIRLSKFFYGGGLVSLTCIIAFHQQRPWNYNGRKVELNYTTGGHSQNMCIFTTQILKIFLNVWDVHIGIVPTLRPNGNSFICIFIMLVNFVEWSNFFLIMRIPLKLFSKILYTFLIKIIIIHTNIVVMMNFWTLWHCITI